MTVPLRRAHLRAWIAIVILNVIVLIISLVARRESIVPNESVRWEQLP
jgi:hypothetical protein